MSTETSEPDWTKPPSTPDCEPHTPSPPGYVAHAEWAEEMGKTHKVRRCRGCGRFLIWEPKPGRQDMSTDEKTARSTAPPEEAFVSCGGTPEVWETLPAHAHAYWAEVARGRTLPGHPVAEGSAGADCCCGGCLALPARRDKSAATLPPLPEFTCGSCGTTFGTNCDEDDIQCVECDAHCCPHCEKWFGGFR